MSDPTIGVIRRGPKSIGTGRLLRRLALGIAGVVILMWFAAREERINSYRGIESSRWTGLSEMSTSSHALVARMLMKGVAPKVVLEAAVPLEDGRQIARTASLHISVRDFSTARDSMEHIVSAHSGFVSSLNVSYRKDSARSLSAQLAIPSAQRDAALDDFRKLGRMEEETQGSEEVTSQSEDLDIRLKNSREEENRLASILRMGTGKVSDVLEVEQEQTRVRGEIETMEANQRRLKNRVALASIELDLTEDYQAQLGFHNRLTALQARNAFVDGLRSAVDGLLNAIMVILSAGPSLLLWGLILFWPVRWAWRHWRSSRSQAAAGT